MKVLYVLANCPQASESYIEAEMSYVRSRGVEVQVWSNVAGFGDPAPVRVHRGALQSAVSEFRPDLVHVHYLVTAAALLPLIPDVPATVRAHSFDWAQSTVEYVSAFKSVRAIYAFPHFAREVSSRKVVPLPVAYDATLYDGPIAAPTQRDRIVRLAAGRRVKGLEDFMAVSAKVSPRGEFHLAVCQVRGDEEYVSQLTERGRSCGVQVHQNLLRAQAVELTRTAEIYLDTSDPGGHPFGMPISIAEAMASGLVVIARDRPGAREYIGEAGMFYESVEEATALVETALECRVADLEAIRNIAMRQARKFRSDVVLPRLVDDWKTFTS